MRTAIHQVGQVAGVIVLVLDQLAVGIRAEQDSTGGVVGEPTGLTQSVHCARQTVGGVNKAVRQVRGTDVRNHTSDQIVRQEVGDATGRDDCRGSIQDVVKAGPNCPLGVLRLGQQPLEVVGIGCGAEAVRRREFMRRMLGGGTNKVVKRWNTNRQAPQQLQLCPGEARRIAQMIGARPVWRIGSLTLGETITVSLLRVYRSMS